MASDITKRFIAALQAAEKSKDAGPLAELFATDAELQSIEKREVARGTDGARQFWGEYLSAFESIRSEFGLVVEGDGGAFLEWTSTGALPTGKPVEYRGVSVLELDGDKVKKFRTYYDTTPFVAPKA